MKKSTLLLSLPFIAAVTPARAVEWWGVGGTWHDPQNWSTGVIPGQNDDVYVNDGIAGIEDGSAIVRGAYLGNSNNARGQIFVDSGRNFLPKAALEIARYPGTICYVYIVGGTLTTADYEVNIKVGMGGEGFLIVRSGGTMALQDSSITLGAGVNGTGSLDFGLPNLASPSTGGTLTVPAVHFGPGTGMVRFNQTDTVTFSPSLDGSGSLQQRGPGTSIITGAATHTGGTTISGGTLQIGNGGNIGSVAGNITNNASLAFNRSDDQNFGGVISGTGRVVKENVNTVLLTAANTFTGGALINGGTLRFGSSSNLVGAPVTLAAGGFINDGGLQGTNGAAGSGIGGAGGTAVVQTGAATMGNGNTGKITGGRGGDVPFSPVGAMGGAGGTAVMINAPTELANFNEIAGGAAGIAFSQINQTYAAPGGTGINFAATGTITNYDLIAGGNSSTGTLSQSPGAFGIVSSGGGTVVNEAGATIMGGIGFNSSVMSSGLVFTTNGGAFVNKGLVQGGVMMENHANSVTLFTGSLIIMGPLVIGTNPASTLTLDGIGTQNYSAAVPGGTAFVGSLVKRGSGIWTMDQAINYGGSTTVTEGTLILPQANLADGAAVEIGTNAVLQLSHSSTDKVASFSIGGAAQAAGTWGSLSSSATFKTDRITGTGMLMVGDPYGSWATGYGMNPAGDGAAAGDKDSDSLDNGGEFILGGSPVDGGSLAKVHTLQADSSADEDSTSELILTVAVPVGTPAFSGSPSPTATYEGFTITVQGSLTLASDTFTAAVAAVSPVTTDLPEAPSGYEYRSFSLTGSNGNPDKGFMRVKVEKLP